MVIESVNAIVGAGLIFIAYMFSKYAILRINQLLGVKQMQKQRSQEVTTRINKYERLTGLKVTEQQKRLIDMELDIMFSLRELALA